MSRSPKLLVVLTAFAVLLTACGGDGGSDQSSTPTPAGGNGDDAAAQPTADPVTLRFASFSNTGDTFMQESTWFMDQVEERSGGAVIFERHFDGSLVPATDNFSAIVDGRVDMGIAANVYEPSALPLSQITVPFAAQNPEALIRAVSELYDTNEAFREEYESQGVKVLAWGLVGTSTAGFTQPVEGLEDLRGLRLRTAGLLGDALAEVGADPVFMALGDTYEAIDRGVLEGWVGFPLSTATQANLQEVADHWVDTGVGVFALTAVAVMNLDSWDKLDAATQEMMEQVGKELLDESPQIAVDTQSQACDELLEAGVTVTRFPEEDVEEWRDLVFEAKTLPAYRASVEEAGVSVEDLESFESDFFETYEKYESESDFVDPFVSCAERS